MVSCWQRMGQSNRFEKLPNRRLSYLATKARLWDVCEALRGEGPYTLTIAGSAQIYFPIAGYARTAAANQPPGGLAAGGLGM
jgi:hypothetical protein